MNTLASDYCAHCLRAKAQGFTQMPFQMFVPLYAKFMGEL